MRYTIQLQQQFLQLQQQVQLAQQPQQQQQQLEQIFAEIEWQINENDCAWWLIGLSGCGD